MIMQKSKYSNKYHRKGCQYIQQIKDDALEVFDIEDMNLPSLQPCKCCCSLKNLFRDYNNKHQVLLNDMSIITEYDGEQGIVHTPNYDWRILFNASRQKFKLYYAEWDSENEWTSLIRCSDMDSTNNIDKVMGFIINEERLADYPSAFKKYAIKMNVFAENNNIEIKYDGNDFYALTDMAIWKISYSEKTDLYTLWHSPFIKKTMTMEDAQTAKYHRQKDVDRLQLPDKHLKYIVKHDEAKKIEQIDYKMLPHTTQKEKKYYKQAKNRARRNSINRVFSILAELENKGEIGRMAYC